MLIASYQVLLGHVLTSNLFNIPQGASLSQQEPVPGASSPSAHTTPQPKWWHHSPDPMGILPFGEATSKATPEGFPSSKWQEIIPLHKVLMRSHQEAFD